MLFYVVAFFAGMLILQLFTALYSAYLIIVSVASLIVISFILYHYFHHIIFKLIIITGLGFIWAWSYVSVVTSWNLPKQFEGENLVVIGHITSLPKTDIRRANFIFTTTSIKNQKQRVKLKLNWYHNYPKLTVGDKWQLEVRLKRPHANLNPGGFNFEKYLLQHKILATGYVITSANNQLLAINQFFHIIDRLRQYLRAEINQALFRQPLKALIATLVVGDQSNITESQWQIFRDTGTSYLMAIAGLHIGLAAGLMLMLVQFLWCYVPRLVLWVPAKQAGAVAGLIAGVIYSVISGFSVPTQRSLIMLTSFLLTLMLRITHKSWNTLFLSLFIVLLIDPLVILEIGFWLSFTAVAFIIYFSSNRLQLAASWWKRCLRMQWAVTLGLVPLTLLFFQQISLISLLANVIALPVVCFVVMPASLVGGLFLPLNFYFGRLILLFAEKLMELTWLWLEYLAKLPNIIWHHPIFNLWILLAATIGLILLLAPRGMQGRMAGLFWLLPLLFYKPVPPKFAEAWFTLLDMRRGMAAVIETRHHVLLYYLLPTYANTNQSETVIIPFLRNIGVDHIDTLMVNHENADLNNILSVFSVKSIVTSNPQEFTTNQVQSCYAGQNWHWDGVNFSVLYPTSAAGFNISNQSCVLKITVGNKSILLPGAINISAEKFLARHEADKLAATILVAPYRTSNFTVAKEFINKVAAKHVLFLVNYRSFKRLLSQQAIIDNYRQSGAKLYYTANSGAITFRLSKNNDSSNINLQPEFYRDKVRRYWDQNNFN